MTGHAQPHAHRVEQTEQVFTGRIIAVRKDIVTMPGDTTSQRDVVEHPGAVAVVALDETGRVLMVNQYRHPVGRRLDELPAGLLDQPGEPALHAAQRELVEEAGLAADSWHALVDILSSPGMSDEAVRIFLARAVREVPRSVQEHEEIELVATWLPLEVAVRRVLAGQIENAVAVVGLLAAEQAVRSGVELRPPDAPWASQKRG